MAGIYTSTAAFPYIRGPEVRRWIRGWLRSGETRGVIVRMRGASGLEVLFATPAVALPVDLRRRTRRRILQFVAGQPRSRSRSSYQRWERDPILREVVLEVWGSSCQVKRCRLTRSAGHLSDRMTDVHHLSSVSRGGDDSPLNLCVICVLHHQMIHRGPTSTVVHSDLNSAAVVVNGLTLEMRRDVRTLMAALSL